MNEVFEPVHNALAQLEGADRVVKLLTAEAILTQVLGNLDEDDLAADMLDDTLTNIAFLIERA